MNADQIIRKLEAENAQLRRKYAGAYALVMEASDACARLEKEETLNAARLRLVEQVRADDSQTYCACCDQRVRNDKKGMTRWQAQALLKMVEWDNAHPGEPFHAATLLGNTDAARDHGASLLRHWAAIAQVDRPATAIKGQKGSRGFSGFYIVQQEAHRIARGGLFHKNIKKDFGAADWTLCGPMVSLRQVMRSKENTDDKGRVIDGTTSITGVEDVARPRNHFAV